MITSNTSLEYGHPYFTKQTAIIAILMCLEDYEESHARSKDFAVRIGGSSMQDFADAFVDFILSIDIVKSMHFKLETKRYTVVFEDIQEEENEEQK